MKIPFLNTLKLSCCEATLLMEQQNANTISFTDKIKLKMHILICKWCEAYNKKLKIIDANMKLNNSEKQIEINNLDLDKFKDKVTKKLNL